MELNDRKTDTLDEKSTDFFIIEIKACNYGVTLPNYINIAVICTGKAFGAM